VLLAAFTAANAADGIRAVALPLVAVELTQDPVLVASLGVAQSLPYLLVGLPAGVVVDRVDRRRLLAVTNTVEAVLFILVLAGVLLDALTLGLLYLAAVSLGTNETLRETAVPAVVPISQLEGGNGRLVKAEFIANQLIGPALGAALFTVAMAVPFALSAGLAATATVLVLRLPRLNRDLVPAIVTSATMPAEETRRAALRTRATRLTSEVADGVGFLSRHPVLRTVAVLAVVLTLTDAAWFVVLVLLVTEELRLDGSAYGLILAIAAIGGAAGGLGAGRLVDRLGSETVLRGGPAGHRRRAGRHRHGRQRPRGHRRAGHWKRRLRRMAHCRRVAATSPTPDRLLGRVTGAWRTAAAGAIPVGSLLGGLFAGALGLRAPFLIGAPFVLAAGLFAKPLTAAAITTARANLRSQES